MTTYFSCLEVTSLFQEMLRPPAIGFTSSMMGEAGPKRNVGKYFVCCLRRWHIHVKTASSMCIVCCSIFVIRVCMHSKTFSSPWLKKGENWEKKIAGTRREKKRKNSIRVGVCLRAVCHSKMDMWLWSLLCRWVMDVCSRERIFQFSLARSQGFYSSLCTHEWDFPSSANILHGNC